MSLFCAVDWLLKPPESILGKTSWWTQSYETDTRVGLLRNKNRISLQLFWIREIDFHSLHNFEMRGDFRVSSNPRNRWKRLQSLVSKAVIIHRSFATQSNGNIQNSNLVKGMSSTPSWTFTCKHPNYAIVFRECLNYNFMWSNYFFLFHPRHFPSENA